MPLRWLITGNFNSFNSNNSFNKVNLFAKKEAKDIKFYVGYRHLNDNNSTRVY